MYSKLPSTPVQATDPVPSPKRSSWFGGHTRRPKATGHARVPDVSQTNDLSPRNNTKYVSLKDVQEKKSDIEVLLLGSTGVGKTSLVHRYSTNR